MISAAVKGDRLCLTVEDDGLGINNVRLQALLQSVVPEGEGNGIGCRNIDQRIKLHFGSEFGLPSGPRRERAPGLRWRFLSVLYQIFKEMIGILDRIPEDISRIMVTNKPEGDGSSPAGWKAVYDAHGPVPPRKGRW